MAVESASPAPAEAVLEPEQLRRYADAVVRGCLHLGRGDTLIVQADLAHRELAIALVEAGYQAGASLVDLEYLDRAAQAARIRNAHRDEYLGPVTPWRVRRLREQLKPETAVATIIGESEPGVFDGLPAERVAADAMRPYASTRWFVRAAREGRRRWAGAAWPTPYWATQVYRDADPAEAQRRLAQDLLWFCRLGPDDPPGHEGWTRHVETVAQRARTLTELELKRLELRGPGTELTFRLSPGTRWLGGQEENAHGQLIAPNLPTEESFTSPDPAGTEGTFRCSRPLSFRGREIDGIAGEFRGGRLVRLDAASDDDRDFLGAFIHGGENADRLGEVALVDRTSRIGQTERVYWNTLIDENAVAHIAFGSGFGQTRVAGVRGARRVNDADLHLDVMIGADELEATGVDGSGGRVPLIADGEWQI